MSRKNTQRAAIREYLASHPLSSTREIVDALHLEFHSTSGNLTNLYTKGEVVRERDEFGVFRYALKDATPTQEAPVDIEIPSNDVYSGVEWKGPTRKEAYASELFSRYNAIKSVVEVMEKHPNSTEDEIRDFSGQHEIVVGGILLYLCDTKRAKRTEGENAPIRYSLVDNPKKLVKVKTLDDFTPREMFEHLKKLGYKWKPDSLYHEKITVERNYVEFDKI